MEIVDFVKGHAGVVLCRQIPRRLRDRELSDAIVGGYLRRIGRAVCAFNVSFARAFYVATGRPMTCASLLAYLGTPGCGLKPDWDTRQTLHLAGPTDCSHRRPTYARWKLCHHRMMHFKQSDMEFFTTVEAAAVCALYCFREGKIGKDLVEKWPKIGRIKGWQVAAIVALDYLRVHGLIDFGRFREMVNELGRTEFQTVVDLSSDRSFSPPETVLRLGLREAGLGVVANHFCGKLCVDLVVEDVLVVEIDGFGPHGTREAFLNDRARDRSFRDLGLECYRFGFEDIVQLPQTVEQIERRVRLLQEESAPTIDHRAVRFDGLGLRPPQLSPEVVEFLGLLRG